MFIWGIDEVNSAYFAHFIFQYVFNPDPNFTIGVYTSITISNLDIELSTRYNFVAKFSKERKNTYNSKIESEGILYFDFSTL